MSSAGAAITRETVTERSPAIALLPEHELLRERDAGRWRRVGANRDGLGDAAGDHVAIAVRVDRDLVLAAGSERALEARVEALRLEVVEHVLGLVLEAQNGQAGA